MPQVAIGSDRPGTDIPLHVREDDFVAPWLDHNTVLLQHGFCRNGDFWSQWVPYLGHDYRVLRPDLRGCGLSGDPGQGYVFTFDDLISDFIRVLDSHEVDAVHYVGEGMGGIAGVAAAVAHPERFRSLSLVHVPTRMSPEALENQAAGGASWEQAIAEYGVEEWWARARKPVNDMSEDSTVDAYFAHEASRTPVHVALGIIALARSYDLSTYFPKLRVPTHFVNSRLFSHTTSSAQQLAAVELVPDATLTTCDTAGRSFFMYTDVDVVAPVVLDFMLKVDGAR